jgi:hypothetical protein
MRLSILFLALCAFGFGADLDISPVLENIQQVQAINTEQLIHLSQTIDSRDGWAATVDSGPYEVIDGSVLVTVGKEFRQATSTTLTRGIWWNSNANSAFLRFGKLGNVFELPPGGTITIGMFDFEGMLDFDRQFDRPVMIFGAARDDNEFQDLMKSNPNLISLLRTKVDWLEYIADSEANTDHPLHGLTQPERDIMVEKTRFRGGGIAGTYLGIFRTKLSAKQFREVMRDFGLDIKYLSRLPDGHDDMECIKRATCKVKQNYVCTSNC